MAERKRPAPTLRERSLASWRGYEEPADLSRYQHDMAEAVARTMKGLGFNDRFHEDQIFSAWSEVVGDFIAANARPTKLERSVLTIQVLNSSVHYEMERMKSTILAKMQDRFGKKNIREVRFRLG
jgi:predicted nucleic acid-binding Zn ribbon protein